VKRGYSPCPAMRCPVLSCLPCPALPCPALHCLAVPCPAQTLSTRSHFLGNLFALFGLSFLLPLLASRFSHPRASSFCSISSPPPPTPTPTPFSRLPHPLKPTPRMPPRPSTHRYSFRIDFFTQTSNTAGTNVEQTYTHSLYSERLHDRGIWTDNVGEISAVITTSTLLLPPRPTTLHYSLRPALYLVLPPRSFSYSAILTRLIIILPLLSLQ
jgi:hypothetical protein